MSEGLCCVCGYSGDEETAVVMELRKEVATLTAAHRAALEVIQQYGGTDGAHHKDWVLDQVARILTGPGYEAWVKEVKSGEDGPDTYPYEIGVAP